MNGSKISVEQVRRDADAGVGDAQQRDAVAPRSTETVTVPAAGVYLSAFETRFPTTCSSRTGSPSTRTGVRRSTTSRWIAARSARAASASSDRSTATRRSDDAPLQRDLAGLDARHLEEVVHQPRELAGSGAR